MLKHILFSLVFICGYSAAKTSLPDESKITITSNKASCQQNMQNKKQFIFTYLDNVKVSFSDGSNASADKLVVDIDTAKSADASAPSKGNKAEQVKKITLSDHVLFTQPGRKARADKAVFYPDKKQCLLVGNVLINQKQTDNKTVPMSVRCSKAALDLVSGNVKLLGTEQAPVSTTLVLNKKASLLQQPVVHAHANNPATSTQRSA
ncbi:hypothetical protein FJ365_03870 [Candidatus Dependentiae bacterium]|nr:hypothetical protein [Candidatus Dependentiae bacterium]